MVVSSSQVFLLSRCAGIRQEGKAQDRNGPGKQKSLWEAEFYSGMCNGRNWKRKAMKFARDRGSGEEEWRRQGSFESSASVSSAPEAHWINKQGWPEARLQGTWMLSWMLLLYQKSEPRREPFLIIHFQILLLYLMCLSHSPFLTLKNAWKSLLRCERFLAVTQVSCPSVAVRAEMAQVADS